MQRQGKRLAALGLLIGGLSGLAPGTATAETVQPSGGGVAPLGALVGTVLSSSATLTTSAPARAEPGTVSNHVQAAGCVSPTIPYSKYVNPPYSFKYKSTTVDFRQWQPSDYSYARVVTRDKRIRVYLESKKGRKCGPFKVGRIPHTKKYLVITKSLPNRNNSVRICVYRYGVAGHKCGAWKKEGSQG
ncbi:hypothetical protein [Nonomuraea basaltis]|uniref:hypothetical protein n=1 Tax=Nonomuraea basaltis TaxID=2495887 RepID=UPI00110C4F28|nr:hypothetical protein [Nonomuraea basaltis]TMR96918.1 hypothetical protein EJK15_21005 [Nonomuraea basaltis]